VGRAPAPFLESAIPDFAAELRRLLEREGRPDLAEQVTGLPVVDRCRCGDDFCAMFYAVPRPGGAWGPGHETIILKFVDTGMINIDLVAGRIVAVEVLYRQDIQSALARLFP
jgi:hypothetical protein